MSTPERFVRSTNASTGILRHSSALRARPSRVLAQRLPRWASAVYLYEERTSAVARDLRARGAAILAVIDEASMANE